MSPRLALVFTLFSLSCTRGTDERGSGSAQGALAVPTSGSGPAVEVGGGVPSETHQLLILQLEGDRLTVLSQRAVDGPLPVERGVSQHPWQLLALDAAGDTLEVWPLAEGLALRAEFPRPDGQLEGHLAQRSRAVFPVRLRSSAASELRLESKARALPEGLRAGRTTEEWVELARVRLR
jgi:hypothetical protein